jgi:hypothetical protein
MLVLSGLLYFGFFVRLGSHTLYGHLSRIAATHEANELSTAVTTAVEQAYATLSAKVFDRHRF